MVLDAHQLISLLADGEFHSGTELGAELGVTRTSIWNNINKLNEVGIEVFAVRGRGYKLRQPLTLLDSALINAVLPQSIQSQCHLLLSQSIPSTNAHLLAHSAELPNGTVSLAEHQTAGRGRRGREWVSPYGQNIYLSVLWRFECGPSSLSGLSLAVGVVVAKALAKAGYAGVGLKWPNDIVVEGRKLGGILLELSGETGGPCQIVVGLGLNCHINAKASESIDQAWVDLNRLNPQKMINRNQLVAGLLTELMPMLDGFLETGLKPWLPQWRSLDWFDGKLVTIRSAQHSVSGIAQGVDESGALRVSIDGVVKRFNAGEVSLRG